jgi:predicted DNA-binding transcriptional regulator YafY
MKTIKNLERLQGLHNLIKNEATGAPQELAAKMDVSERTIYILIDQLKDFEAKIKYSRKSRTYYYCDDFELWVNVSVTVMSNDELIKIFAGSYFLKENTSPQGLCIEHNYLSTNKTNLCA